MNYRKYKYYYVQSLIIHRGAVNKLQNESN